MNFEVLWLFAKFGDMAYLAAPASNPLEFASQKSYLPPIHESFSCKSSPLYSRLFAIVFQLSNRFRYIAM